MNDQTNIISLYNKHIVEETYNAVVGHGNFVHLDCNNRTPSLASTHHYLLYDGGLPPIDIDYQ